MAGLLAAAMVAVVGYCLARSFAPSLRAPGHRRDIDAWHVLMGSAMAVMLLAPFARVFAVLAVVVFAAGLGYALLQASRRASRAAFVRLGVGCAAMTAMLLPSAATATPVAASADLAPAGEMAGMAGMAGMPGMQMDASAAPSGGSALSLPTLLVVGLLVVLGVLLVVRLLDFVRRSGQAGQRLDALCEAAMAGAMGYMLLLMT